MAAITLLYAQRMTKPLLIILLLLPLSARAEGLDSRYWKTLGECSGLYLFGDSESDQNGYARITRTMSSESKHLDRNDAFRAGMYFGSEETRVFGFYQTERTYHADSDYKAHRLKRIIDLGCERF